MDIEGEKLADELTDEIATLKTELRAVNDALVGSKLETINLANRLEHWKNRALDAEEKNRGK